MEPIAAITMISIEINNIRANRMEFVSRFTELDDTSRIIIIRAVIGEHIIDAKMKTRLRL